MRRIEVTDAELAIVKQAVESYNDMSNDMWLDDLPVDLFPRGDEITTITADQAIKLRGELNAAVDKLMTIRTLMNKLGSKVNEAGYSV